MVGRGAAARERSTGPEELNVKKKTPLTRAEIKTAAHALAMMEVRLASLVDRVGSALPLRHRFYRALSRAVKLAGELRRALEPVANEAHPGVAWGYVIRPRHEVWCGLGGAPWRVRTVGTEPELSWGPFEGVGSRALMAALVREPGTYEVLLSDPLCVCRFEPRRFVLTAADLAAMAGLGYLPAASLSPRS